MYCHRHCVGGRTNRDSETWTSSAANAPDAPSPSGEALSWLYVRSAVSRGTFFTHLKDTHEGQVTEDECLQGVHSCPRREHRESFVGLQERGMSLDLSWGNAAEQYEEALLTARNTW